MGRSIPSDMSSFSDDMLEPVCVVDDDDEDDALLKRDVLASFASGLTTMPRLSNPAKSSAGALRTVDSSAQGGPFIAKDSAKSTRSRSCLIIDRGIDSQRMSSEAESCRVSARPPPRPASP